MLRLIADDLTGAADAAVPFVTTHDAVRIGLGRVASGNGFAAVDTGTREAGEDEAVAAVRAALAAVEHGDEVVLKIDSLLRGHVRASVAVLRDVLRDRVVVAVPAFPAMGRTTRGGVQCGVDVAALLPVGVALHDAETDADLDAIVAARAGRPTAWVGTGGITRALARRAARDGRPPPRLPRAVGPLLAVVGSTCETARAQVAALAAHAVGDDRVVTSPEGNAETARRAGLVLLSGGRTARAVLDSCGVAELEVMGEVEPGVVALRTASLPGTVVTKAGSFGDAGTLVRVVDALRGAR